MSFETYIKGLKENLGVYGHFSVLFEKRGHGSIVILQTNKILFFCRYNIGLMLTNKLTFGKTHAAFIFFIKS